MKRAAKATKWGLREALILLGGVLIAIIYLFWVTKGFTARPEWLDAWQIAKLQVTR